jgi:hypothetical protein
MGSYQRITIKFFTNECNGVNEPPCQLVQSSLYSLQKIQELEHVISADIISR